MRVLVVKLSSLGDILHALPAVAELHRQLPAEIHWAVQPEGVGLVELFDCVEKIFSIPRRGGPAARWRAVADLRAERYDLVVDLQGLLKSAVVSRLVRAPRRIGPSFHREGSRFFYSALAGPRNKNRHAVEECMDLLDFLGLSRPATPFYPLRLPPAPEGLKPASPVPRIAIAPLSRWSSKNWPLEHFASLARQLYEEFKAELHITGAAADRDAAEKLRILAAVPMANHCGTHSLGQTCALLKRMDVLVANDSGPVHMAAAVGTPCVVMFGPTLPDRTGPYGEGHRVLRLDNCPPCRSRHCLKKESICLTELPPELALRSVREVLENGRDEKRR